MIKIERNRAEDSYHRTLLTFYYLSVFITEYIKIYLRLQRIIISYVISFFNAIL